MTGDELIIVYHNTFVMYQFTVNDTDSFSVEFEGVEPDSGGVLTEIDNGKWSYSFTWNINDSTNFSLSFVATDTLNASATLKPQVWKCFNKQ